MKLQGIRVVDLSLFLPGPYLTLQLAESAKLLGLKPKL